MIFQSTINGKITYSGMEPYGGQTVRITIHPAEADTGIVFATPRGEVRASLDNARVYKSSILLKHKGLGILHTEHILATLFAYGVDNVRVQVERENPSFSFRFLRTLGLSTSLEVVPNAEDREGTLCELLEQTGTKPQNKVRKILSLSRDYISPRLSFRQIEEDRLIIKATTNYPVPGKEELEIDITPEAYRTHLAQARPYVKHFPRLIPQRTFNILASLANPSFGLGHDFSEKRFFFPVNTQSEWRRQEIYPAEIARHTIDDRLGAIALLDGRLSRTMVNIYLSGHANDLATLRKLRYEGYLHSRT